MGARHCRVLPLLGALTLTMYSAACASTGAVPRPFPTPGGSQPAPVPSAPVPSAPAPAAPVPSAPPVLPAPPVLFKSGLDGYALAGTALSLRGAPYRNG